MTDGGEGILGLSSETIKQRASALRHWYSTEEGMAFRNALNKRLRDLWLDPTWRADRTAALRNSYKTNPNIAAALSLGRELSKTEKQRAILAARMALAWEDRDMRAKFSGPKPKRGPRSAEGQRKTETSKYR